MKKINITMIGILFLLTACGEESPPELDVTGHWIVEHGFYDDQCQVGATFTDDMLVLTFFSRLENACQPQLFGIEGSALPIQIYAQNSYFDQTGVLSTDLALAIPERGVAGEATLSEADYGLTGMLTDASGPDDLFALLLQPTYKLRRDSGAWLPSIDGKWGAICNQIEGAPDTDELCELIDFSDADNGRVEIYVRSGSSSDQPGQPNGMWAEAIFALRHVTATDTGEYTLDFVIIPDAGQTVIIEGTLVAFDGTIELSLYSLAFAEQEPDVASLTLTPIGDDSRP